jgi:hypothetical protein
MIDEPYFECDMCHEMHKVKNGFAGILRLCRDCYIKSKAESVNQCLKL